MPLVAEPPVYSPCLIFLSRNGDGIMGKPMLTPEAQNQLSSDSETEKLYQGWLKKPTSYRGMNPWHKFYAGITSARGSNKSFSDLMLYACNWKQARGA